MGKPLKYLESIKKASDLYASIVSVYDPYFKSQVIFNSDGFHHLRFSAGRERKKAEQLLKCMFIKHVPYVVRNAGTLQEHRKTMEVGERRRYSKGERDMVFVEYWGFIAIIPDTNSIRIKVILRRSGHGSIHFWSVMPYQKKGSETFLRVGSPDMTEG
jgi:hypothetical protein